MAVQAGHQFHAMIFDGLGADFQDFPDLFGVLAFGDESKDFALPEGQLLEGDFQISGFRRRNIFHQLRGVFRMLINNVMN